MSLLPFIYGHYVNPRHRPHWPSPSHLLDQDFGLALTPDDFLTHVVSPRAGYLRPWRQHVSRDLGSSIKLNKDKFEISLDVQHFSPDEISVKVVDGHVVVEGRHEERKDDHGYISRQFTRRYPLPEGVAADSVQSQLSSDGVLIVTAAPALPSGERPVPITQTGPVRKEIKEPQVLETSEDIKEDPKPN